MAAAAAAAAAPPRSVDDILASMVAMPADRLRVGLQTLRTLLSNVATSPGEERYRRVKKTNAAIASRLFPQCFELLRAAGFEDAGDTMLLQQLMPDPVLHDVLSMVDALLLSLGPEAQPASSSAAPARATAPPQKLDPTAQKKAQQQLREDRLKAQERKAQSNAQEQLAALRHKQSGRYQEQQDRALATYLSSAADEMPFDAISAMNRSSGAFVTCTGCGGSLRYSAETRAQAVLCPCGALLQPVHLQGQSFAPRAPSDIPVEPGELVGREERRATGGPAITVRGPDGQRVQLPLHSVLQMVRNHEERRQTGAADEAIEALPTRIYRGVRAAAGEAGSEHSRCQVCMEDFAEGDELRTLPCLHLFHTACVDQWLKVNSICPTCRHKV
eukprot:NODE_7773_length_1551_cov_8.372191.p1 GENE.NODE_7773_length_1551_cov_8.372191~~NODE_7773_length_1551_cov_8.372191.p1  ORF type:complete len:413 (+),score=132.68 NODE_7773_length_1551_cov_8.372191:81-1241(+)